MSSDFKDTVQPLSYPWSDELKLSHAMERAEQLIDAKPRLAEIWLKSADIIRARIASLGGNSLT
jgi:hypothetical protein